MTAGLQEKLAASLHGLGRFEEASRLLTSVVEVRVRELGPEHPTTLEGLVSLATAHKAAGDLTQARELFEGLLPALARTQSAANLELLCRSEYADTLALQGLYGEAYGEFTTVLDGYREAGRLDDPTALRAGGKLARAYLENQNFKEAVPLLEGLVPRYERALGPDHPDTLGGRNDLAMAYQQAGDYVQCIPLLQQVHEALIARLGVDHPRTLTSHFNLAQAQRMAGDIHHAVPILERLVAVYEARFGPSHATTTATMVELAAAHMSMGDYPEARRLYETALEDEPPPGEADLRSVIMWTNFAHVLHRTGDGARALEVYEEVFAALEGTEAWLAQAMIKARFQWTEILAEQNRYRRGIEIATAALALAEEELGNEHPVTMYGRNALSYAYRYAGEIDEALPLLEANLAAIATELGDEHPQTIITRINFASAVRDAGDLPRALRLMEQGIEQSNRVNGPRHATTLLMREIWCDTLDQAEDWERSVEERERLVAIERERGEADARLASSLRYQAATLLKADRGAQAEPILREALSIQEAFEPDLWTTFRTQSMLGDALFAQGRREEAEDLLLAGHAGMRERAAEISRASWPSMLEVIERLVRFYEETDRPEEAERWRDALEEAQSERDG